MMWRLIDGAELAMWTASMLRTLALLAPDAVHLLMTTGVIKDSNGVLA